MKKHAVAGVGPEAALQSARVRETPAPGLPAEER
ncbi:hypothetical protein PSA7680_01570 [Pseudoruegeria aquimaris]|uniref:Uncharacterized protein n=1 Tax=Pseudoruegeria aquimaris TaxID=393663 RepID=A0A1Y5S6J0_9RHOB|nr:hypothetical protein PSA7680_01570 [Pseudoruegeria aquimaris]